MAARQFSLSFPGPRRLVGQRASKRARRGAGSGSAREGMAVERLETRWCLAIARGDFNQDQALTATDLDDLSRAVRAGNHPATYDVTGDGLVDVNDRDYWIDVLRGSRWGDSDFSGTFGTRDLVAVFQAGEYEDDRVGNSSWRTGDWNGDTEFNVDDLVGAFQRGGFELPPATLPRVVEVSPPANDPGAPRDLVVELRVNSALILEDINASNAYLELNGTRLAANLETTDFTLRLTATKRLDWNASVRVVLDGNQIRSQEGPLLDGDDDGLPGGVYTSTIRIRARESVAPTIRFEGPLSAGTFQSSDRAEGFVDGTGSEAALLSYSWDGLPSQLLYVDPSTGKFDQPLNVHGLSPGTHTLRWIATDEDGNTAEVVRSVQLGIPFELSQIQPLAGANEVGATFRPQITFSRAVDRRTVTQDTFFVTDASGAKRPANMVVANDNTAAWLFFDAPLTGSSQFKLNIDVDRIVSATGDPLEQRATTEGNLLQLPFTTVSTTALEGTELIGQIVDPGPDLKPHTSDDALPGPDGQFMTADDVYLLPIAGVKVFILGREKDVVTTDANGRFRIAAVPVGNVKIETDGRTALAPPANYYFPDMVMDAKMVAGQANFVMAGMETIYLPRLRNEILQQVDSQVGAQITAKPEGAPDLSEADRALLSMSVPPGSMIDERGQPMTSAAIGISTVPPELVRDMLPAGVLQHTFDITVQAMGVATFSQPVALTFPNTFGAAPGAKLNFLSFDHTTGRLEIEGTATVSADGRSVSTDPGTGVTHPGWHGLTPPGGPAGPNGPAPTPFICSLDTPEAARPAGREPVAAPPACATTVHPPIALPFVTTETTSTISHETLRWTAPRAGTRTVRIEIDGPLSSFMKPATGGVKLKNQTITLRPGARAKSFSLTAKNYQELLGTAFANIEGDRLYGAKITVTEMIQQPGQPPVAEVHTYYLYRWISATYALEASSHSVDPATAVSTSKVRGGNTVAFFKTLADGPDKAKHQKDISIFLPSSYPTAFQLERPSPFQIVESISGSQNKKVQVQMAWFYDPVGTTLDQETISIAVEDGKLQVGELIARGRGVGPVTVNLDVFGYMEELRRILTDPYTGLKYVWVGSADLTGNPGVDGFDDDGINGMDDMGEYGWPGSDDVQVVAYAFSPNNISAKVPFPRRQLAGPTLNHGTHEYYVMDIDSVYDRIGTGESYRMFKWVSDTFKTEFPGMMPNEREDLGPDGIAYTTDDRFTPAQLSAFESYLERTQKSSDILRYVEEDFRPVDDGSGAYNISPSGPTSVTVHWGDTFTTPSGEGVSGLEARGTPLFGFANGGADLVFPADRKAVQRDGRQDGNQDGMALKYFLEDPKLPAVAKAWALAEQLNTVRNTDVHVSLSMHLSSDAPVFFGQTVANTASHELGHVFGLNDSYLNAPSKPGTAGCVKTRCIPFDLMMDGSDNDPDLEFKSFNITLLQGAMGIISEKNLIPAIDGFRRIFNLPYSSVGLRQEAIEYDENGLPIEPSTPAEIAVVADNQYWRSAEDIAPLSLGEIASDGPGGARTSVPVEIVNTGFQPLRIASIQLLGASPGITLELPNDLLTRDWMPGETANLQIQYDPLSTGDQRATLEILSNAQTQPRMTIALEGTARLHAPVAQLELIGSNNLGGVDVLAGEASSDGIYRITSAGTLPLVITSITMMEATNSFQLRGLPNTFPSQSITLAPGESLTFGASFNAEKTGLQRNLIRITSNHVGDALPFVSLVGTGLDENRQPVWGNDSIALITSDSPNAPTLRTRSDNGGNFEFFVPPEAEYDLFVFDHDTGQIGSETGTTEPTGAFTPLATTMAIIASTESDSDYDGLPDDIELALGTSSQNTDSDRDGVDDFVELDQGLEPLSGQLPLGLVAALDLPGRAVHVSLAAHPSANERSLAYVALAEEGLAIVDVTTWDRPVLVSTLKLQGNSQRVEVDGDGQQVIVVAGIDGVQVVDVSDPQNPVLRRTLGGAARDAILVDGAAIVGRSGSLDVVELESGKTLDSLPVDGNVRSLQRDGTLIYAYTNGTKNQLLAIRFERDRLAVRGIYESPESASEFSSLVVADRLARMTFVTNPTPDTLGSIVTTVDFSQPDQPRVLLRDVGDYRRQVALTGSGLIVSRSPFLVGRRSVMLISAETRPDVPASLVTRYEVAGRANHLTLAAGVGYLASEEDGLGVFNYFPLDTGTSPPTITAELATPDEDPLTPEIEWMRGRTIDVTAHVRDDAQVRQVEMLIDDVVVRTDISYPFDFRVALPTTNGVDVRAKLQWRATDTGGNSTLTEPLIVRLIPDLTPPQLIDLQPANGSVNPRTLRTVTLEFSEPLDLASVAPERVELIGPTGRVTPLRVRWRRDAQRFTWEYPELAPGSYQLTVHAVGLWDRVGNPLGAVDRVSNFTIEGGATQIHAGTFTSTGNLMATVGQQQAVGDFNGDGRLDVAGPYGQFSGFFAPVLLNEGQGRFRPAPLGNRFEIHSANQVVTYDFNRDGKLDLLTTQRDNTVSVMLGLGDGTFGPVVYSATQSSDGGGATVAVGDLNGDGLLDMVTGFGMTYSEGAPAQAVLSVGGALRVRLGNGDGTFRLAPNDSAFLPIQNSVVYLADLNADQRLDLVVLNSRAGTVSVVRGMGDGSFAKNNQSQPLLLQTTLASGAKLAAFGDLNGDGHVDLAVTGNQGISLLFGNGDLTFQPADLRAVPGVFDVVASDINQDGRLDLLATIPVDRIPTPAENHGAVAVLRQQANGTFAEAELLTGPAGPLHLAMADFNADGRVDLLTTNELQGVHLFAGRADGTFTMAQRYSVANVDDSLHTIDFVRIADLNGDGQNDWIVTERAGWVHVRLGTGNRTFAPTVSYPVPYLLNGLELADVNADGRLDVVLLGERLGSTQVIVLSNLGDGTLDSGDLFPLTQGRPSDMLVSDMDEDGLPDIVVGLFNGPDGTLAFLKGLPSGEFKPAEATRLANRADRMAMGDVNEDGNTDLVTLEWFGTDLPSTVRVLLGDGTGKWTPFGTPISLPPFMISLTLADIDADGHLDVLTGRSRTVENGQRVGGTLHVLRGLGNGSLESGQVVVGNGWSYFELAAADLNNDGRLDVVASTATAAIQTHLALGETSKGVAVLFNDGQGQLLAPTIWEHSGTFLTGIAVADLDDDSLLDIVTANGDDGTVSALFGGRVAG